jgi:hypothetical protein
MEGNMSRNLSLIVAAGLALVVWSPVRGQDAPSLGDVARQAQKDKVNKPAAKVITNDDMPSRSGGGSSAFGGGTGRVAQPGAAGTPDSFVSPAEGLAKLQSMFDELDSQDRATLANNVLEGHNVNFPGRPAWEQKLFAAKQNYVAHGRALLEKAKQIENSAEGMKDVQDPNDPRVKSITAKLQQLVQENQQNSDAFKATITEGQGLAAQAH